MDALVKEHKLNTHNMEIAIAKMYLYLLPFRMISPLLFIKDIVGVCALYTDFVLHMAGMLLWVFNCKGNLTAPSSENKLLITNFIKLVMYLNCSSIVMSFVIDSRFGRLGNDTAFDGIMGMLIYFTQYALMLLYNMRVFSLLDRKTISKILHQVCVVLLVIGYMQVLVMNGIGGAIYDAIDILDIVRNSNQLPKLCLTGSEGAAAGSLISLFVMPVLLSDIIVNKNTKRNAIEIILWLIPLYFTQSSTAYILFTVEMIMFAFLMAIEKKQILRFIKIVSISLVVVLLLGTVLGMTGVINDEVVSDIQYLLFDKATDENNGSTISRTVPLMVNWGAFTEYPLFGVGNGLQGYFYEKYFPEEAYRVQGSDVTEFLKVSRTGISNGGVFFPSLLSGYGTVGMILIVLFIFSMIKVMHYKKTYIEKFYYMWILASAAFLVTGFQGDLYGKYYAWFMISLPFISSEKEEEDENDAQITDFSIDSNYESSGNT